MPVTLRPRCNLGIEAKNAASGFTDVMVFGLVQFGLESLFFMPFQLLPPQLLVYTDTAWHRKTEATKLASYGHTMRKQGSCLEK